MRMYEAGTKIYDEFGELFAELTSDVDYDDPIMIEQFRIFQGDFLLREGEIIPDPIWLFTQGRGYKPKG